MSFLSDALPSRRPRPASDASSAGADQGGSFAGLAQGALGGLTEGKSPRDVLGQLGNDVMGQAMQGLPSLGEGGAAGLMEKIAGMPEGALAGVEGMGEQFMGLLQGSKGEALPDVLRERLSGVLGEVPDAALHVDKAAQAALEALDLEVLNLGGHVFALDSALAEGGGDIAAMAKSLQVPESGEQALSQVMSTLGVDPNVLGETTERLKQEAAALGLPEIELPAELAALEEKARSALESLGGLGGGGGLGQLGSLGSGGGLGGLLGGKR